MRTRGAVGMAASSVKRSQPLAVDDERASLIDEGFEGFLQLGDGDDWPAQFGAARLGIP